MAADGRTTARPPHVLLYTDDPEAGGVAQYNHALLCDLAARGYAVTCAQSRADNPLTRRQAELGVRHAWLGFDTAQDLRRSLTDPSDARRVFRDARPDLVLFSNCCPVSNFAAKRAALELGLPYVIVEGFVAPYLAGRFADLLGGLAEQYARARAVVAVSRDNLGLLRRYFRLPADKGQVVYYGRPAHYFDPPDPAARRRLRAEWGIPSGAVLCFTAARLEAVKGYYYQVEAIRRLKDRPVWPRLYFAWAGPGSLQAELAEAVRRLEAGDRVKFLGQRWDVADWLDAADLFLLPSEAEGMPLAVMEAMAKGLPVVASAVSGIPEELGDTGRLIAPPRADPEAAVQEMVAAVEAWARDAGLRAAAGAACRRRAGALFREERMLQETAGVLDRALLPEGDYVSQGLEVVRPDACFPHLAVGDPGQSPWPYLRRHVPHNWYVDRRCPAVGLLSRDEAHLLYNNALQFRGRRALEIGCFLGWSTCHLALAGVELDVVDPLLARPDVREEVASSLRAAGVLGSVHLVAGHSPRQVEELAARSGRRWSLIFIDGDHDAPGPLHDAAACARFAAADALVLFHDLASPDVARGLDYLRGQRWDTMLYQTMQLMGAAWRGDVRPVPHRPDPRVRWQVPEHLAGYPVSGVPTGTAARGLGPCDLAAWF